MVIAHAAHTRTFCFLRQASYERSSPAVFQAPPQPLHHRVDVVSRERKCVHHWYFNDLEPRFIHIRLQEQVADAFGSVTARPITLRQRDVGGGLGIEADLRRCRLAG